MDKQDKREINDILIVGDSKTSFLFSKGLHKVDNFTRVVHVIHSQDAVKILVQEEFSVIVIDNDAPDVDPIPLSNLIRSTLPLSRNVIISRNYSVPLIKNMINSGSIDGFIPIPIDPFTASTIIIEQHAKFQINQTLYDLITVEPPKFSPSYYLLQDANLREEVQDHRIKFIGFVIIYSSLTKFAKFYSNLLNLDEYLITGYISAISLLGQQLFAENSFFKEINFGGISVVMHKEKDVQYLFFFQDLTKQKYKLIEDEMDRIISTINSRYIKELSSEVPTTNEVDQGIENIIDEFNHRHKIIIDKDRKQNLVLFGNQLPKLNVILAKNQNKYNISRYFEAKDVIDHLINEDADILVINQVLDSDQWNFTLASQAKDINPSVQIVALLKRLNQPDLLKILNNDYLDFVLSYKDTTEEIQRNLDQAFKEASNIKSQLHNYQPHNIQYSLHRSVITRGMLRSYNSSFQRSQVPNFYGVFIMQGDLPYYSKLWPVENSRFISFDEQLFAGFVSSMEMFTDEIFDSQQEFSGFRFGDITILIKHHFEFSFVYFLGNIDHTNFLMIDKQLSNSSQLLHDIILNSEGFFNYNPNEQFDVTDILDQQIKELFLKLVSLNFGA